MVDQLKQIFGFEDLSEKQIQSKLESMIAKHPYFHLAQLYRLQLSQAKTDHQPYLSKVAVNTYQRRLLKQWIEKNPSAEKKKSVSTKAASTKSKSIDELITIPDSAKVIRPNQTPSVYGNADLSKKTIQPNEVFTETLAELCIEQHQYQKAIEVLDFLKSTDSKKSDYFARRITEVRQLQKKSHHNS